jgi:hypothetical protein
MAIYRQLFDFLCLASTVISVAEASRGRPGRANQHRPIRYVVGMIVERTFRETRTEKKGATFFRAGAFVALDMGGSRLSQRKRIIRSFAKA